MKTLIILAGLPGVGKSYCARILKNKLRNCLYFDSDLFSKEYIEEHKLEFMSLSKDLQSKQRLKFHRAKIDGIKKKFQMYDVILLDTCFDLLHSRKMFYQFAKEAGINLIVIEIICSEKTVKSRILAKKHEKERMVGTKESRWRIYKRMKSKWRPIKKVHFVLDSEKDVGAQLDLFLKQYKL